MNSIFDLRDELIRCGISAEKAWKILCKAQDFYEKKLKEEYYRGHSNGKQDGITQVKESIESAIRNIGKKEDTQTQFSQIRNGESFKYGDVVFMKVKPTFCVPEDRDPWEYNAIEYGNNSPCKFYPNQLVDVVRE